VDWTYPIPTAEMNVPKKANVRITPKFLKKFSFMSAQLQKGVNDYQEARPEIEDKAEDHEE